jgi:heme/copper-type cytochrome/quinol oxidase subunit 4
MKTIINIYKGTKNKKEIEWFKLNLLIFVLITVMTLLPFFFDVETRGYSQMNNALLIGIVTIFGLAFINISKTKKTIHSGLKYFTGDRENFSLVNYGDVLLFSSFIVAVLSFLFVLDVSFVKTIGVRIGTVIAVNLINIGYYIHLSKRNE